MKSVKLLSTKLNPFTMHDVKEYILKNLESLRGSYVCIVNVHTTVLAHEDNDYLQIQDNSNLNLCDGKPLDVIMKLKGFKDSERITGPDLMSELFESNVKHYFYGSTSDTLLSLENELVNKYPYINIVGMYSPPFRDLSYEEEEEIRNQINSTNPDIVWVGLGAPKQEVWMFKNKKKINGLMIGVGAGFDYHAGNIRRAPRWMQRYSMEWIYRLIQDPKRLWKRYLEYNSKFIYYLLRKRDKR